MRKTLLLFSFFLIFFSGKLFCQVTSITGSYWSFVTPTDTSEPTIARQTTIIIDQRPQYNKIEVHFSDGTVATYFIASKFTTPDGSTTFSLKNPESSYLGIESIIVLPKIAVWLVVPHKMTMIVTGVTAATVK